MLTAASFGKVVHDDLLRIERRSAIGLEVTPVGLFETWLEHRHATPCA